MSMIPETDLKILKSKSLFFFKLVLPPGCGKFMKISVKRLLQQGFIRVASKLNKISTFGFVRSLCKFRSPEGYLVRNSCSDSRTVAVMRELGKILARAKLNERLPSPRIRIELSTFNVW